MKLQSRKVQNYKNVSRSKSMVLISKSEPYFVYKWNQVESMTSITSDSVERVSIPIPYYMRY